MKQIYLAFAALCCVAFNVQQASGQCPGCNINTAFTQPGVYPNPLPDGTQGQPYDEDVTFVLFTDTSGFTVNYFKITSVSGLPFGLNWQCNNAASGCQYNPQTSLYGCVKICGVPLQAGDYVLNVNLDVNLQLVGTQQSTLTIPIHIASASGGNAGFAFSPAMGCDSLTVAFNALIAGPGMPSYQWDFGDGTTSSQPVVQHHYAQPGEYITSLQTTLSQFAINTFNVASVNSNWCGDIEEPNLPLIGCQGAPDLYFVLTDAAGNQVYTSSIVDDVHAHTWNGLNIGLGSPPYSVTIWDDDPVSVDDNLGTFSFSPASTGVINLSGAGGTTINITVGLQTVAQFNDADTIMVMPSPLPPPVSVFENDTICVSGSAVLSVVNDSSVLYQWFAAGSPIPGASGNELIVSAPGSFAVAVTSASGCGAFSAPITIHQLPPLPNVNFQINGNTLTTFLTQYNLQWFANGQPIAGATDATFQFFASGSYHLEACDDFGCCRSSDTFNLTYTGIDAVEAVSDIIRFNPQTQELSVSPNGFIRLGVVDALGRMVVSAPLHRAGHIVQLSHLPDGIYHAVAEFHQGVVTRRIMVLRR